MRLRRSFGARRRFFDVAAFVLLFSSMLPAQNTVTLHFRADGGDTTLAVREALERVEAPHVVLIFEPGRYVFEGDFATQHYLAITNHDNGLKRIAFPMNRFETVSIRGNGAEFIFRGQFLPFLFEGCHRVELADVSIDWEIPFHFQATVAHADPLAGHLDVVPFAEGYSWSVRHGQLVFPQIDGVTFSRVGETLAFDPQHRRVAHGAWDMHLASSQVEQLPDGKLRLPVTGKYFPPVGTVIVAKGPMGENRYAPAVYGVRSRNLVIKNVTVHHAIGMGFLFERCDTITLSGCGVFVREGSDRMVSALADATHFCNTKGEVLIENSRFQHMLDDGTNVHGTYVVVDQVLNDRQVRARLMHFQQAGHEFAAPGDELWLIRTPDPSRAGERIVTAFKPLNETYSIITFNESITDALRPGDLLENKTWNPSFTMRGCTISDHRARGIVLKTPRPILIENNHVSSMMSAVLFRGESRLWYESGQVEDVLIRNNRFTYSAYSGTDNAILLISPRLGRNFDATITYDRNIRFTGNQIETFGDRIVWAERTTGLQITHNTIIQTRDHPVLHPAAALIDLTHCHDTLITGNSYQGTNSTSLATDATSLGTLTLGDNPGFRYSPTPQPPGRVSPVSASLPTP